METLKAVFFGPDPQTQVRFYDPSNPCDLSGAVDTDLYF